MTLVSRGCKQLRCFHLSESQVFKNRRFIIIYCTRSMECYQQRPPVDKFQITNYVLYPSPSKQHVL